MKVLNLIEMSPEQRFEYFRKIARGEEKYEDEKAIKDMQYIINQYNHEKENERSLEDI